jgi:uncharacterized protein
LTSILSKLLLVGVAAAAIAVPPLKSRVTDLTGTLNGQQRSALEQTLAEFEARKGSQVAVLLVPTTQPESIEQYSVRVEEAWKLGRKGVDDSVLLVVAKDDRKVRLEVGYGLEGVLPDAAANRIIREDILPRFKQGDFYGGLRAGTDRIMRTVEGEPLPPPRASQGARGSPAFNWFVPVLIFVFVVGGILRSLLGKFLGSGVVGGIVGFGAWLILGSLAIGLVVGALAFVFGLVAGVARPGIGRYGDYYGGWGGGFGGGGGGFGGGGFGGGGGRSGGGGASGGW